MPVPEAAMDEDGDLPLAEPHVRLAGKLLRADGIAVAACKEPLAEEDFRRGVAGMYDGHDAAALGRSEYVWHTLTNLVINCAKNSGRYPIDILRI